MNMKTLLAKFFQCMASRVALACIATGSVAIAHDVPQHFPAAPTDWGMIQQDCLGLHSDPVYAIPSASSELAASQNYLIVVSPDEGEAPAPIVAYDVPSSEVVANDTLASDSLIGPQLYDGVDCAKLESFLPKQLHRRTRRVLQAASRTCRTVARAGSIHGGGTVAIPQVALRKRM